MSFADDLQRERENHVRRQQRRVPTFESVADIVRALSGHAQEKPNIIALDMFIAFRERFPGGWNLWLGSRQAADVSPEDRAMLPRTSFAFKATHYFWLSLWTSEDPDDDESGGNQDHERHGTTDVAQIPDGAEIFVGRVTGPKVYKNSQWPDSLLAQGNTSRIEEVTVVEDDDITTVHVPNAISQRSSPPHDVQATQSSESSASGSMEYDLDTASTNGSRSFTRASGQLNHVSPTLDQPNVTLPSEKHPNDNLSDNDQSNIMLNIQATTDKNTVTTRETRTGDENCGPNVLERTANETSLTANDANKKREGSGKVPNGTKEKTSAKAKKQRVK